MTDVRKYAFTRAFEAGIALAMVSAPRFYETVGRAIDPERMPSADAALVVKAAKAVAKDSGACSSRLLALQCIRSMVDTGKVTYEAHREAERLLDLAEDIEAASDIEALIALAVPTVSKAAQQEAIEATLSDFGKGMDAGKVVERFDRVASIGHRREVATEIATGTAEDIRASVEQHVGKRLPTGVPDLDSALNGGMECGALGLVMGHTGVGKCHAVGQGILMYDGSVKKVEDVCSGDFLMGMGGARRRVLRTNSGRGELYEVCPVKGSSWKVNVEHILTLVETQSGRVVDVSVRAWLGWSKRQKHLHKLFREGVEFAPKVLPIDPYFFGVYLGDGSTAGRDVRVTTADPEILVEVEREAARRGLSVSVHSPEKHAPGYALVGRRGKKNPLSTELEKLGLRGVKSGGKFVPEVYKTTSCVARAELLAGLLDTDGSLMHGCYDFISKSRRLAEDVAFLARSLGLAAYIRSCEKGCQSGFTGTYYRVTVSGEVSAIPVRVVRKKAPARQQKKNVLRTGFSVKATGEVKSYYGFTLDGDGRYLLNDFTVTHNSMMLTHIVTEAVYAGLDVAYVTLELSPRVVKSRVYSNLCYMTAKEMSDDAAEASRRWGVLSAAGLGRLETVYMTAQATTVTDVRAWLKDRERESDFRPKVIVVDMGDHLVSKVGSEKRSYDEMRIVFSALREMAVEREGWAWSASHVKFGNAGRKKVNVDQAADSAHKSRLADVIISMAKTEDDEETGQVRFGIPKRRIDEGVGGSFGPVPQDCAHGRVVAMTRVVQWG